MNIIRGPLIRKTQKPKKNPGFITVVSPQIPENLIQIQDKTGKGFWGYLIAQSEKLGRNIAAVFQSINQKRPFFGVDDPVLLKSIKFSGYTN